MDLAAGTLMAALALPLAWVASARRGYLPAVAALLLIVVATHLNIRSSAVPWRGPANSDTLTGRRGGLIDTVAAVPVRIASRW